MQTLWPAPSELAIASEHQRERYARATAGPVGILAGNPGAGKTHLSGQIIAAILNRFGSEDIAVCAPTGKAAQRITEVMLANNIRDVEASTIHRMLGVSRNGHDGKGWAFNHNSRNPLRKRFVFGDEKSMLGTTLGASLVDALMPGTHLLFVGDFAQLPPVEHGAPLRDMIAAGLPYGELTSIHRNDGDVIRACQDLKEGRPCRPSPYVDLPNGKNFLHIECSRPSLALGALGNMLRSIPSQFDPVWDVQVLCAVNPETSAVGRKPLNRLIQDILNPAGHTVEGSRFRMADKVMCLSNGLLPMVTCPNCKEAPELMHWVGKAYECQSCGRAWHGKDLMPDFVANGEMGSVAYLDRGMMHVDFASPKRTLRVAGEYLKDFDLAYACTVHKSQGSAWPVVIVMIDDSNGADMVTSHEWHRTALSRMEKLVITVGKKGAMDRQCRRSSLAGRKTFLRELLEAG